uniref:Uncharacterized protein n=1 Tax=Anguilla anguilla TaxID=7936 RepID=A0A0E9Q7U4_ANGAN
MFSTGRSVLGDAFYIRVQQSRTCVSVSEVG